MDAWFPLLPYSDVSTYIQNVCQLLSVHRWICDFKVTDFFLDKVWQNLPKEWYEGLESLTNSELNNLPYEFQHAQIPKDLRKLLQECLMFSLPRDCLLFAEPLKSHDGMIERGLNPKKRHEVTQMAKLVYDTVRRANCNIVLDVGSGVGYLGHVLSSMYKVPVICIESKLARTHTAELKANKLSCSNLMKCVTLNVDFTQTESTVDSLRQLFSRENLETVEMKNCRVCMVGLHCCGDLTPSMIKLFTTMSELKAFVCVSCCYHRMTQNLDGTYACFPLSSKVTEGFASFCSKVELGFDDEAKKISEDKANLELRRVETGTTSCNSCVEVDVEWMSFFSPYALRLASQETRARWRRQTEEDHNFHVKTVAYRAIVEVFLNKTGIKADKLRRKLARNGSFESFSDYIHSLIARISLNCDIDEEELYDQFEKLHDDTKDLFPYIEIITALQVCLQPVLESFVTVDRCMYLEEHGLHPQILPVFDEFVSPRNLAIICYKD